VKFSPGSMDCDKGERVTSGQCQISTVSIAVYLNLHQTTGRCDVNASYADIKCDIWAMRTQ